MPPSMTFGDLHISYDDRVLEPRRWTTLQALWAADLLRGAPAGPVLELGSGAGHIGLLAISRQPRPLVSVDESAAACELVRRNAAAAGLEHLVDVRQRRLESATEPDERFALVIADPPWVPSGETHRHPQDPPSAIDGGPDGLAVARTCLEVAGPRLLDGASILLQLGTTQQADALAAEVADLTVTEVRRGEGGVVVRFVATP